MSGSRYEIPAPTHAAGESLLGFRVDAVTELPDVRARAYECTHLATGARLLHLHCNDQENMYAIAFRTTPSDSTGVAHILEHSVLAGSKRYPVKDAFNELSKGTLHTFLNAMTWPDRTVYPVCSAVRPDFWNLASVYTDLVLHPLLSEQTFRQEGHHLEFADLENPESDLVVSGVVYNEMKGAYSSPDRVVYKAVQEALYPDTCYGIDSGGDPEHIPDLTYEQFRNFHESYYSPSNARWYLYGDLPLADHLAFVGQQLQGFGATAVRSEIQLQARWTAPRRVQSSYPIAPEENAAGKTFINVSWMLDSAAKPDQVLLFDVLREALLGTAASPLRKALVDSGLGQDLSPVSGHDTDFQQTLFSAGLRGCEPDSADAVEKLVLGSLERVVQDGLDPQLLQAAFHQIEFRGLEIVPPFPVMLLMRAAAPANYGADPKSGLEFGRLIAQVRARHAADPALFQKLIRSWLIDNPHRLLTVVVPDPTLAAEREARTRSHMAERKARMSAAERATVLAEAKRLKQAQQTPDSPEALATMPRLRLSDVPRRLLTIPTDRRESGGVPVIEHPVFSNGVVYVQLAFDVADLSEEEAPWVALLGQATAGLGAAGLDYAAMATRIARVTGGIGYDLSAGVPLRGGPAFQRLIFHGKALRANSSALAAVLRDLLTASDVHDEKRVREIVLEARNDLQAQVVSRGSLFAYQRAAACLDLARYRIEQWSGTSQMRFLSGLARELEAKVAPTAERIARLQKRVFARGRLTVNLTGDPDLLRELRGPLEDLLAALPEGKPGPAATSAPPTARSAGVAISSQVNYVAQVLPVAGIFSPAAPALEVLASILSSDYLYARLRVQGGAYGGFASYRPNDGILAFLSYRDPHLVETLDVYRGVGEFVRSGAITPDLLNRSKIGTIGGFDRILSPAEQGMASLRQHFLGLGDPERKAFRDGLLDVTVERLRDLALPAIEAALGDSPRAVLAPRAALEAANTRVTPPFAIETLE